MHRSARLIAHERLALCRSGSARFKTSPSSSSSSPDAKTPQKQLKWTQREEAPKWLQRMSPTRGGTALPTPKEAAVIAAVMAAGYYAWFVDPPKPAEEH